MKSRSIIAAAVAVAVTAVAAVAYDVVIVTVGSQSQQFYAGSLAQIRYGGDDYSQLEVKQLDGTVTSFSTASNPVVTFGESDTSNALTIAYGGSTASVSNGTKATYSQSGNKVTVTANTGSPVDIIVTGTGTNAQVKVYGNDDVSIYLDGATITNNDGPALNFQGTGKVEVVTIGASTLTDADSYTKVSGESQKGTVYGAGQIVFSGSANLTVKGLAKHAICAEETITVCSGSIVVTGAESDAFHSEGFTMAGGSVTTSATGGDGIDAGEGLLTVNAGSISVSLPTEDTKGLKTDGSIVINGGDITLTMAGDQTKGIRPKSNLTITGGSITATATGGVVITDGDPSYCTVVKADSFTMTGGEISIKSSGAGGKGFSIDSDAEISGGSITVANTGKGAVYTDASGNKDTYTPNCFSIDGNATISGGTFNLSTTGDAGKAIKVDGWLVMGAQGAGGPSITAMTSGSQVSESSSSTNGGGWGGGWGPGGGGFDSSSDYANPKVIKAAGQLTIYSGTYNLTGVNDGAECLESKAKLYIYGGTINCESADDCINASSHIEIAGGVVRCNSTGNDAIDSNGTITLSGGVVLALGTGSPECGFDCDNNRFAITGGYVFGIGGDTSSPTSSYCTQGVAVYQGSLAKNAVLTLCDSDGNQIMTFTNPKSISSPKMLISAPEMTKGGSYTIYTGGTVTGGIEQFELTTGATYTPGTSKKTFTLSSMVTTVK